MKYYILVDASYYICYRVYALYNWWKLSHPDESYENLHENPEFLQKYKDIFVRKFEEIPKKLGIEKGSDITFIVTKDCNRDKIWRRQIYPEYKANRDDVSTHSKTINPRPFFDITYNDELFEKTNFDEFVLLQHDHLEGDDCIAITLKCIQANMKQDDHKIFIITSDTDFLQLYGDNVSIVNLKFKDIRTKKNSFFHPEKDLLRKILTGDKSDNIPPVFKRITKKKILYYYDNTNELFGYMKQHQEILTRFMLNCFLIDFNKIPQCFVKSMTKALEKRFFPQSIVARFEELLQDIVMIKKKAEELSRENYEMVYDNMGESRDYFKFLYALKENIANSDFIKNITTNRNEIMKVTNNIVKKNLENKNNIHQSELTNTQQTNTFDQYGSNYIIGENNIVTCCDDSDNTKNNYGDTTSYDDISSDESSDDDDTYDMNDDDDIPKIKVTYDDIPKYIEDEKIRSMIDKDKNPILVEHVLRLLEERENKHIRKMKRKELKKQEKLNKLIDASNDTNELKKEDSDV